MTSHSLQLLSLKVNFTQIFPFNSQQSIAGFGGKIKVMPMFVMFGEFKLLPLFHIISLGF